jgi:DNA polymerase-1
MAQQDLLCQKYDELAKQYPSMADMPNAVLHRYCGYDVDAEWRIYRILAPKVAAEKVRIAFKVGLDLVVPIADMEYRGIHVHRARLQELSQYYREKVHKANTALVKIAQRHLGAEYEDTCTDGEFNYKSPKQLSRLLMKVTKGKLYKRTPTGGISTDKTVMGALSLRNDTAGRIARHVTNLRLWGPKYISQFLDGPDGRSGLLGWMESLDRVHTSYNLGIPRTGRLSSGGDDSVALQVLPRTGDIRTMFIPDTPDDILIASDFEKLELCVNAWLSNDRVMAKELIEGQDLHSRMAITKRLGRDPTDQEFESMLGDVGKEERAQAKAVNFGVPYGMGSYTVVENNPEAFPLDMKQQDRIRIVDAIIDAYFKKYWATHDYMESEMAQLHRSGWLRTPIFGRKRRLSGIKWYMSKWGQQTTHFQVDVGHLEREARNFKIQSIASEVLSVATKRVWDGMQRHKLPGFRMLMTLHDALVFNVRRRYALEACELIKGWMERVLEPDAVRHIAMPLQVEVLLQDFWGEEYMEPEAREKLKQWYRTRGVGKGAVIDLATRRVLPPRYTRLMRRAA